MRKKEKEEMIVALTILGILFILMCLLIQLISK